MTASAVLSASAAPGDTATVDYSSTIPWDATYDVVVIGFGGSAAVTAITAAENGSHVLCLEKAPKDLAGGNTRVCGQHLCSFDDYDAGVAYLKAVRGEYDANQTDEHIENHVREVMQFVDWWEEHGKTEYDISYEYDFEVEGHESVYMVYTEVGTQRYWIGLRDIVRSMSGMIDVWYEAPAQHIIQDPFTKTAIGVEVETQGRTVKVHAEKAVVMACGGFENNREMQQDYLQRIVNGYLGTPYNTGDGVKMALEAGAGLWHMSVTSGPKLGCVLPTTGEGIDTGSTGFADTKGFCTKHGSIFIGPDGTRWINEDVKLFHGFKKSNGTYMQIQVPMPSYMLIDGEAAKTKVVTAWSDGMVDEVEKGWVWRDDTLDGLAQQLGMDSQILSATVERYNGFVEQGDDADFHRAAETLFEIGDGPYYAIPITPFNLNTQGGPHRDPQMHVLDPWGNRIPRLYAVGECGSMFPSLYNGGCNIAECFSSGRIAGKNAAGEAVFDGTVRLTEVEPSSEQFKPEPVVETYDVGENQYLGYGEGIGGEVVLRATIVDGDVRDIEILKQHETYNRGSLAFPVVLGEVMDTNSLQVDAYAGATMTCNAIFTALTDIFMQAGLDYSGAPIAVDMVKLDNPAGKSSR